MYTALWGAGLHSVGQQEFAAAAVACQQQAKELLPAVAGLPQGVRAAGVLLVSPSRRRASSVEGAKHTDLSGREECSSLCVYVPVCV